MENFAIGIDIYGQQKKFEVLNGCVYCPKNNLTSLILPQGVETIYCYYNQLTSLTLPKGVKFVNCYNNPFIGENYFVNPKTNKVVILQDGLFYAGCFCGKTKQELIIKCKEEEFIEVLEHFGLN